MLSRPQPGFSEQDPQDWWRATVNAVRSLPAAARAAVRAVGLSGQMHGATLLDEPEDRPLRPAILWNDGRSARECVELERREPQSRAITGNIMMPGFTAPKLLWVSRHEPEMFARTACVLLPKDFVRLKLTGERVSDMSDASGTGWLDVGSARLVRCHAGGHRPDSRAHAAAGRGHAHRPASLTPRRPTNWGLPRGRGRRRRRRQCRQRRGYGRRAPGQAFLSLGTSGVLFVVTDRFRPNPERAAHAFCHCLPGRWHQMAVMLSAASALDWVAQLTGMRICRGWSRPRKPRGLTPHRPFFLPYLSGERTPHNDPHARGVFFGIGADTAAADLYRAVLEGVALAFADGLDVLLEKRRPVGEISVTGGGARLPYWGELLAAALNRPLTYRLGGEVGARAGRRAAGAPRRDGGESPRRCALRRRSCGFEPRRSLSHLLADRRRPFVRLYQDLKNTFLESAA